MDCLEGMKQIEDGSVDLVLTDPPYGTTAINWDLKIDLDKLWVELIRVSKENTPFIFFGSQPFTTDLINSKRELFRYCLVWEKTMCGNPLLANVMPLKRHEDIIIFYKKAPDYNPIKDGLGRYRGRQKPSGLSALGGVTLKDNSDTFYMGRFPSSILKFPNPNNYNVHPTQKPVNLIRFLIKSYSEENELILDPFMGSGTTAVACQQLNRNFIGFEINPEYVKIANERLKQKPLKGFFE